MVTVAGLQFGIYRCVLSASEPKLFLVVKLRRIVVMMRVGVKIMLSVMRDAG